MAQPVSERTQKPPVLTRAKHYLLGARPCGQRGVGPFARGSPKGVRPKNAQICAHPSDPDFAPERDGPQGSPSGAPRSRLDQRSLGGRPRPQRVLNAASWRRWAIEVGIPWPVSGPADACSHDVGGLLGHCPRLTKARFHRDGEPQLPSTVVEELRASPHLSPRHDRWDSK